MEQRVRDNFSFVAVAYGEGSETVNFEQANAFWLFYLMKGKVQKKELLSFYPKNAEERLDAFRRSLIDVVICRNFAPRSMAALRERKIAMYTYEGGCHAALRDYMEGKLTAL